MKIKILTLFPEMFSGFIQTSIIKRALADNKIAIEVINIRDYASGKQRQVDDYPFGGGAGMLLMIEPLVKALKSQATKDTHVVLTTTQGQQFDQKTAQDLANKKEVLIICGHYEGIDARISNYVDQELSIGDYVLTGGELPAMVITDALSRLVESVISYQSLVNESFNNGLLEGPQYTKPVDFEGWQVPEVLLSGHHGEIEKWQHQQAVALTKEKRPDLYRQYIKANSEKGSLLAGYQSGLVANKDYNCAEKVLRLSNDILGLGLEEAATRAAAGFGGGMAIQHLCGAIAGAVMVLSLRHVSTVAHQSSIADVEEGFFAELQSKLGSLMCDELKATFYNPENKCEHIIQSVVEVLDKYV